MVGEWLERWRLGARPPDFCVNGEYLRRWHLVGFQHGGWRAWVDRHIGNVYLHRINAAEGQNPHDHPYWNLSIILSGRYLEYFHDGTAKIRRSGALILRSPRALHRLVPAPGPVWTIFVHGPRVREWGFMVQGKGWMHHQRYLEEGRNGTMD